MTAILDELGYNYTIFNAVDGRFMHEYIIEHEISHNVHFCQYRNLNDSYLEDTLGIRYMDTGLDEYYANDRKMRKGQVGCFLSHHTIWRKVRITRSLILLYCTHTIKL